VLLDPQGDVKFLCDVLVQLIYHCRVDIFHRGGLERSALRSVAIWRAFRIVSEQSRFSWARRKRDG
jgi:hypothetical protein